jgi:hypothetical protein
MGPSIFAATDGKSDEPHDGKNDSSDPQEMDGKTRAEKNQHKQQCENQQHRSS